MGVSQAETLKAVTGEWEETSAIADRVPRSSGRIDRITHLKRVHRDLTQMAKYGLVEKSSDCVRGRPAKWRLVQ
jgi:predicted transcriptional regulator